jgi:G3E family GTPase
VQHDLSISSFGVEMKGALDIDRLNKWLSVLLKEKGTDIFRMKGILNIDKQDTRFVFQGKTSLIAC